MTANRCHNAISLGWFPERGTPPEQTEGLHTRCSLPDDGHREHVGKGLAEYDYQRWHWYTGDRRTYATEIDNDRAWEIQGLVR